MVTSGKKPVKKKTASTNVANAPYTIGNVLKWFSQLNDANELALVHVQRACKYSGESANFSPNAIMCDILTSVTSIETMLNAYTSLRRQSLTPEERAIVDHIKRDALGYSASIEQILLSERPDPLKPLHDCLLTVNSAFFGNATDQSILTAKSLHELIRIIHQRGLERAFAFDGSGASKRMYDVHKSCGNLGIVDAGGACAKGTGDYITPEHITSPLLHRLYQIYKAVNTRSKGAESGKLFVTSEELQGAISLGCHSFQILCHIAPQGANLIQLRYQENAPGSYPYAVARQRVVGKVFQNWGLTINNEGQFVKASYRCDSHDDAMVIFEKCWRLFMGTRDLDLSGSPLKTQEAFVQDAFTAGHMNVYYMGNAFNDLKGRFEGRSLAEKVQLVCDLIVGKESPSNNGYYTQAEGSFIITYAAQEVLAKQQPSSSKGFNLESLLALNQLQETIAASQQAQKEYTALAVQIKALISTKSGNIYKEVESGIKKAKSTDQLGTATANIQLAHTHREQLGISTAGYNTLVQLLQQQWNTYIDTNPSCTYADLLALETQMETVAAVGQKAPDALAQKLSHGLSIKYAELVKTHRGTLQESYTTKVKPAIQQKDPATAFESYQALIKTTIEQIVSNNELLKSRSDHGAELQEMLLCDLLGLIAADSAYMGKPQGLKLVENLEVEVLERLNYSMGVPLYQCVSSITLQAGAAK